MPSITPRTSSAVIRGWSSQAMKSAITPSKTTLFSHSVSSASKIRCWRVRVGIEASVCEGTNPAAALADHPVCDATLHLTTDRFDRLEARSELRPRRDPPARPVRPRQLGPLADDLGVAADRPLGHPAPDRG